VTVLFLTLLVKATLVCGAAFLLSRLFQHGPASIHHLFFAMSFAALLLIPVIAMTGLSVTIPVQVDDFGGVRDSVGSVSSTSPAVVNTVEGGRRLDSLAPAPASHVNVDRIVAGTWVIGALIALGPLLAGVWQARRLRRTASPWPEGQAVMDQLARRESVRRAIFVIRHESATAPLTCGFFSPAIVFPFDGEHWEADAVRRSLIHEFEHVARCDWLTLCLARLICALYWFHPLVWASWRRMRFDAERACDDAVVKQDDAAEYAALLVSMAQRALVVRRAPALGLAGRWELRARVAAVLDAKQARGPIGRPRAARLILAGAVASVAVALMTVAHAEPRTQATQSPNATMRFETISVRHSDQNGTQLARRTADSYIATNMTARLLLMTTYAPDGIRRMNQIDNGPAWIDAMRFDITAKMPRGSLPRQTGEMLRSLLEDRFKLVAHFETKPLPAYALVMSRQDGRPGSSMRPTQTDCAAAPGDCGLSGGAGRIVGRGLTMSQLAAILAGHLRGGNRILLDGYPMIDRTGLDGSFDFTLEWKPDPIQLARRGDGVALESIAPNFFLALSEQLGLRLEDQLAPQRLLSIDRIEQPIDN